MAIAEDEAAGSGGQGASPLKDARPRRIQAADLLGEDREVIIEHRSQSYRLRITSNEKLILTK